MNNKRRIIIGITGSSGIIYGINLLLALRNLDFETHLVVSKAGQLTRAYETDYSAADLKALADVYYPCTDFYAPIASGSFRTMGMIIAPCSMKTLGEIASGVSSTLISRAADVTLKERRKLVLLAREAPLHLGHLNAMVQVTQMGGIIFPPVPAFYTKPENINDIVNDTVGRVLDLFEIDNALVKRWGA